jgi:hypothetical protein
MINMHNEQAQALESTWLGKDLPRNDKDGPFVAGYLASDWSRVTVPVTSPS